MRCPSCGSKVKRSQSRCPTCGEPLVPLRPSFGGAALEVRPPLGYPADLAAAAAPDRHGVRPGAIVAIAVLLCVAVGLAVLLSRVAASPSPGVQLDEATFPSAALRAVVRTFDTDGDGALSDAEVAAVTTLDCSYRDIDSLQGLRSLTALTELNAAGNQLTQVDLSSNAALVSVNLSDNLMATAKFAGLSSLAYLDVSVNQLTALDVSGCSGLQTLVCTDNRLARLDLSTNAQLDELAIDPGQNVTIPISEGFFPDAGLRAALQSSQVDADQDGALSQRERDNVTRLTLTDSSTQDLTGLAWLSSLTSLDASNTSLASLDGTKLPQGLTSLKADATQVSWVDVSTLEMLLTLTLRDDPVGSVDLTGLTSLTTLDVSGTSLSSLDVSPVSSTLTLLYVEPGVTVTGAVTDTSACFPDDGLRQALFGSTDYNPNSDDLLSPGEMDKLTTLNLTGAQVTDLTGLSQLTKLRTLVAQGVTFGTFSTQGLGTLQSLYLSGCSLTALDLTAADSLTLLDVSNNQLTALDLWGAPNLTVLVASGNPALTLVDARACPNLTQGSVTLDQGATLVSTDEEYGAYEEAEAQAEADAQAAAELQAAEEAQPEA